MIDRLASTLAPQVSRHQAAAVPASSPSTQASATETPSNPIVQGRRSASRSSTGRGKLIKDGPSRWSTRALYIQLTYCSEILLSSPNMRRYSSTIAPPPATLTAYRCFKLDAHALTGSPGSERNTKKVIVKAAQIVSKYASSLRKI